MKDIECLFPKQEKCFDLWPLFPNVKFLWVYDGEKSKIIESQNCKEEKWEGIYPAPTVQEMRGFVFETLKKQKEINPLLSTVDLVFKCSIYGWQWVNNPDELCDIVLRLQQEIEKINKEEVK